MFGRLFETLQYLVNGELGSGFQVGMLGIIGSFLFLASAIFGQTDSIVDDRSSRFRKTRMISFAAPLLIIAVWCVIAVLNGLDQRTIPLGVQSLFIAKISIQSAIKLALVLTLFGMPYTAAAVQLYPMNGEANERFR